jgi:hypothetical protein
VKEPYECFAQIYLSVLGELNLLIKFLGHPNVKGPKTCSAFIVFQFWNIKAFLFYTTPLIGWNLLKTR